MTTDDVINTLQAIRPGAQWTFSSDSYRDPKYEGLTWLDAVQVKPTPEELGF